MSELVRLAKEALRQQQALDPSPTIQAGDQIAWDRAGTMQTGVVDYLYTDSAGVTWAFVTIGESWAAVNLKYVKGAI